VLVLVLIGARARVNADTEGKLLLQPQPVQVARTYMNCVGIADYSCVLALFHFPSSYSSAELESDQQAVRDALTVLDKELGRVESQDEISTTSDVVFLSVGGGDLPYWKKHPEFRRFTFKVKFAKEGEGFIFIDICQIEKAPQIRQVHYGLPASYKGARERILAIMNQMKSPSSH